MAKYKNLFIVFLLVFFGNVIPHGSVVPCKVVFPYDLNNPPVPIGDVLTPTFI